MTIPVPSLPDRLSIRERPEGMPIMYQSWGKLLFMHWPIPVAALRPLIPEPLAIDTFDGQAWVGLVPFTIWGLRPIFVPPLPLVSTFHEINVRTYVHLNGVPGVWFFSLDAARTIPVKAARALYYLPYFKAEMSLEEQGQTITYHSKRQEEPRPAEFSAEWTVGDELPAAEPGSLDFFLTERYCLYASHAEKLYRCRIAHPPWPLRQASLARCQSSMLEASGLPSPVGEPLLLSGGPVDVEVWPLEPMEQ